jgi:L-rhamnose isomerase
MAKNPKTAVELASMVRKSIAEPKLRVAVFAEARGGWRATVYGDHGPARDLQKRIDEIAQELNRLYELAD